VALQVLAHREVSYDLFRNNKHDSIALAPRGQMQPQQYPRGSVDSRPQGGQL
jgi:hypothetical protein